MDDDKNKRLSYEEFRKGINEYGLGFNKDEISALFKQFDHDGSGSIDFEEFLIKLRVYF
jgi:Ca2+-binding EF-hand superfamily protein